MLFRDKHDDDDDNGDNNEGNHDHNDDNDNGDITHLFEKINKPSMLLLLSSCNSTSFDGVPP